MTTIPDLTRQLTVSLKKPTSRTLRLIEKALKLLTPFESPRAMAASPSERRDLLNLIQVHRLPLSPYLDLDRIETNLRRPQ